MIAPSSIVSRTEAMGVATSMKRLGVSRFSNRMRMQMLCHFDGRQRVAVYAAHEEPDLLDRDLSDLERLRHPAKVDDRERVAERQEFVEVLRDDQHRRAARGEIDDRLMDGGRGARIDAPCRLADDERLGTLQDLAAH